MKNWLKDYKNREYIYNVLLALQPVVVLVGWLTNDQAVLFAGVASTILGVGLARVNARQTDVEVPVVQEQPFVQEELPFVDEGTPILNEVLHKHSSAVGG